MSDRISAALRGVAMHGTSGSDIVAIDLGDFRDVKRDTPPPRRTVRQRLTRLRFARYRALAGVALAALVAWSLTASRQPLRLAEAAMLGGVDTALVGGFVLDDTQLYVLAGTDGGGLAGYRLADGRRLWTAPLEPDHILAGFTVMGRTIFAITGRCSSGSDAETQATDRTSGRVRWRHHGSPIGPVLRSHLVVFEHDSPDPPCEAEPSPPAGADPGADSVQVQRTVEAVDLDSGRVVWSASSSGPQFHYNVDQVGRISTIVAVERSGSARVIDPTSGSVVASGSLPAPGSTNGPTSTVIWPISDLVLVSVRQGGELALTAYAADSLRPRWTRRVKVVPPDGPFGELTWYVQCGRLLCMQVFGQVYALNPTTGEIAWRLEDVRQLVSADRWLLVSDAGRGLHLVDTRDGRAVTAILGYRLTQSQVDDRLHVVLTSSQRGGGTRIEELDSTGQRRVLGVVPGFYNECQTTRQYVACSLDTNTIRTWRIVEH